jgi:hypothetical protein
MWTAPLNVVRFGATTLWHLDAEERAPSTTSIASFSTPPRHVGSSPENDQTGDQLRRSKGHKRHFAMQKPSPFASSISSEVRHRPPF